MPDHLTCRLSSPDSSPPHLVAPSAPPPHLSAPAAQQLGDAGLQQAEGPQGHGGVGGRGITGLQEEAFERGGAVAGQQRH